MLRLKRSQKKTAHNNNNNNNMLAYKAPVCQKTSDGVIA